jgi:hypothetical protein
MVTDEEEEAIRRDERRVCAEWLERRAREIEAKAKSQSSFYNQYEDRGHSSSMAHAYDEAARMLGKMGEG